MDGVLRINKHPILGAAPDGERISITMDGKSIDAIAGEPVAAALLASGIRALRTMPESNAPRGIFSGIGRSIEELGQVNGQPNTPLMSTLVSQGMSIETQFGLGVWEETNDVDG